MSRVRPGRSLSAAAIGEAELLQAMRGSSWPSVEPAADYTANSLLAFALAAQDHS